MHRLALQESRRLKFTVPALLDAALTFDREHNGWLWRASGHSMVIDAGGGGTVTIRACRSGSSTPEDVVRTPAWVAAALLHYCFTRRIPVPRSGTKAISATPEGVELVIEIALVLPALELSAHGIATAAGQHIAQDAPTDTPPDVAVAAPSSLAVDVAAAAADRRILVLADRTDQVADLQRRVGEELERAGTTAQLFRIDSQMGIKVRRATHAAIAGACQGSSGVCIFATGSLIGEGFDLPVLDTLVLASPISFKGRLVQYAGRLHRESAGKVDVRIHDYLDASSPVLLKMYRKRRKEYETMGYVIEQAPTFAQSLGRNDRIPVRMNDE